MGDSELPVATFCKFFCNGPINTHLPSYEGNHHLGREVAVVIQAPCSLFAEILSRCHCERPVLMPETLHIGPFQGV